MIVQVVRQDQLFEEVTLRFVMDNCIYILTGYKKTHKVILLVNIRK